MSCPRCGSEMSTVDAEARCLASGALIDATTTRLLANCFVTRTSEPSRAQTSIKFCGSWFCPGCGSPMHVSDAGVECIHCARMLNEFLYRLIEFNPHP